MEKIDFDAYVNLPGKVPPPMKPGEAERLAQGREKHQIAAQKKWKAMQKARAEADARIPDNIQR